MRLVISMMTNRRLLKAEIANIINIFIEKFPDKKHEIHEYKYPEDKFFETDIDFFDMEFKKEELYFRIDMLIFACEVVMKSITIEIDFIVANDDTATEVDKYQQDWNDVKGSGLFVTHRRINGLKSYYSSEICNAYLNFEYVSFGVYDL